MIDVRVVVALGGNAISRRGESMTVENQRANLRVGASDLARVARSSQLVITHGNGPQVGLLALQSAASPDLPSYPLDVLGAESQGLIGYLIELEMRNAMRHEEMLTTVLTLTEVAPDDPAFSDPQKFVGPVYEDGQAEAVAAATGWVFRRDGERLRRVVASPEPIRVIPVDSCERLLDAGHVVVAAGGGGIPVVRRADGSLAGVEAVIDKDLASAALAESLGADVLVMATDAPALFLDWGTPKQRELAAVGERELGRHSFPAGSMGPKVEAARRFVRRSGHRAVIGNLSDIDALLEGTCGTRIEPGDGLEIRR